MSQDQNDLGELIDSLDSIATMSANKALPDAIHMQALRSTLPELVSDMKAAFAKVTGENPWSAA